MEGILRFLCEIGKLKEIKRKGWEIRKVNAPESVADHTFRVAMMAILLTKKSDLDRDKCIKMALIHDIGESKIGDLRPEEMNKEKKSHIEKKAVQEMVKEIDSDEILDLWKEYDLRESPEAKFVYELDKIELLLQAFEYEEKNENENIDFSDFWKNNSREIKSPEILEILEELIKKKNLNK